MTAWRRIQRTIDRVPGIGSVISTASRPTLAVVSIDAKHFRFHYRAWTLYVAIDAVQGDPLAWVLLPRSERRAGYDALLKHLKAHSPGIGAVVSDWHRSILETVPDHLGGIIHQRCAAHVLRDVYRTLGGRWWHRTGLGRQHWPMFRRIALGLADELAARRYLERMARRYPEYTQALRILRESLADLYQFSRRPDLPIPRTSNRIENLMGRLEQRLKTMRGVKTPQTLLRYVTYLLNH